MYFLFNEIFKNVDYKIKFKENDLILSKMYVEYAHLKSEH